jgi:hypothetical protein
VPTLATIARDPHWIGPAIPPGEILLAEYLKPLGIGQVEAARRLEISLNRLNEILFGNAASLPAVRFGCHGRRCRSFANLRSFVFKNLAGYVGSQRAMRLLFARDFSL